MFLKSRAMRRGLCLGLLLIGSLLYCKGASEPGKPDAGRGMLDRAGLEKILAENKGRPLVLNFWATWCRTCLPELKTLADIQAKYEDRGLRVVCVSVDPVEDPMRKALVEYKYGEAGELFGGYISGETHPRAIMTVVDEEWLEIVPVTYLISRDGRVARRLVGSRAMHRLESKLELVL